MKKIVFIFGSISGTIVIGLSLIWLTISRSFPDLGNGELIGYVTMIIALSTIFFGVKSYRDNNLDGTISFGKALWVGVLIALVAAAFYIIGWEIYFNTSGTDFLEKYFSHSVEKLKTSHISSEELEKKIQEMKDMNEMYTNNALFRISLTFMEIFPVGLAVSLISAGLLRKKQFLPAS